ncbi:ATP-dependent DNA helicase RecG [Conexibacter sp. W3-3-2]|uniref:ATP-dependent DNA helicase RecG n=1 Tax=Conexibacter sp. W3-3-2 TaxID=2675227 RepID=UPI0012B6E864|nr:ATP-dependent DNA helicase RecG [Conexibacter sp. W3-3-2]MTD43484.1 ATP-dependent DNA helicase RecG [Conexibacter sp. W3-3-2]
MSVPPPPRRLADGRLPSRAELLAAPVRWRRPAVLGAAPQLPYEKAQEAATALGLTTVGRLLEHLPRDRREARTVAGLVPGEIATVVVEVRTITTRPVRRRGMKPLVEATVADETGPMKVVFFNQPWLQSKYPVGTRLVLHGEFEARNRFKVRSHAPTLEATASGDVVAHYPATEGLSSTQILALVRAHLAAAADADEPLPGLLRAAEQLPDRSAALVAAHVGDAEGGRRRLAFDELLLTQLAYLVRRRTRERAARATALDGPPTLTAPWLSEHLPFTPTGDQQRAIETLSGDLAREQPMQRLLMGEVGSGKTVVALHAMLRAVEHGTQAALMAPTETLAEQHFATLQALLGGWGELAVPVALLTGSTPAARKRDVLGRLADGQLAMVVGTHALIEEPVRFQRLTVAVVDEQHRFGVRQRAALDAKAGRAPDGTPFAPHVLHMTATPIPRTLALLGYGDLDVTVLRELPRGRKPIRTHVASGDRERARAYERIREELAAGRQAFVVCALVAESDALAARAATAEFERLRDGELRDHRVSLLHGQMRPAEKRAAMEAFARHESDVLVATTVIEVGIDVPNATVMLIENAERYGISQLHQLRGRVGRGEYESLCLLFGPKDAPRLSALAEHTDGFRLAEIDLELRGEGELIGTRQSGLASFRVAELPADADLLDRARRVAERLMDEDPELDDPVHVLLRDALHRSHPQLDAVPIPA